MNTGDLPHLVPRGRTRISQPNDQRPARPAAEEAPLPVANATTPPGTKRRSNNEVTNGLGWIVLIPLACCAGPFIVAAIVTAGAFVWSGLGAAVTIALGVALGVVVRRRRAGHHCPPCGTRPNA